MIRPMQTPAPPERRSSPFAAAFFSALQPGLGQAYLGRWTRALVWAAPSILGYALLAGMYINKQSRSTLETQFVDPTWDLVAMGLIAIMLIYRLASAFDAFRLANATADTRRAPALRAGSLSGLVAILLVLVLSHVAIAAPFYRLYDAFNAVTNSGDTSTPGPSESIDPSLLPHSLPPAPTDTQPPGETAAPTDTPGPTPTQGPPWDGHGRLNILLLGVDAGRANEPTYNTDTMIVLSVDPDTKQVGLISLPRDTQNIPLPSGWPAYQAYGGTYTNKINTLYSAAKASPSLFPGNTAQRGYQALMGTLGSLYNLDINYYIAVDLNGFRDTINALGGTMVDVQLPVNDPFYPADDGRGYLKLYIPPGYHYFDGASALAYARSRHGLGNDYIRAARQERVITSVREQIDLPTLLSPGVISNLLSTLKSSVKTNIPQALLPKLVQLAQTIDLNKRVSLVLSPPTYGSVCYPCPPYGLWAIKPNISAIRSAVSSIFSMSASQRQQRDQLEAEGATVSVENGTTSSNIQTTRTADFFTSLGIDASVPPVNGGAADRSDYTAPAIIAYNGADQNMPTTLQVLQSELGVTATTATDPSQTADIVVIVGSQMPTLKPPN